MAARRTRIFRLAVTLLLAASGTPAAGQAIDIRGKVTDSATGLPLAGVKVILLQSGIAGTTGASGEYRLQGDPSEVESHPKGTAPLIRLKGSNALAFEVPTRQDISLRVYDARGDLRAELFRGQAAAGHYSAEFAEAADGRYLYRLRIGGKHWSFPFLVLHGRSAVRTSAQGIPQGKVMLAKASAAFSDTLLAAKPGYRSAKAAVSASEIPSLPIRLATGAGSLSQERPTPEQIGLYFVPVRALDSLTAITVRYRKLREPAWRDAHPLLRINPRWVAEGAPKPPVDSYAGTLFDLAPGTAYEVMVAVSEPGKPAQAFGEVFATCSLPSAAPAPTATASPGDNLQQKFNALAPGAVLQLANGTYDVNGLQFNQEGTAEKPIYVRGASRAGVIVRDTSGTVLQILKAAHVVFENFTLQGSGKDDGTKAGSVGVSFWNGGGEQEYVTFRDMAIAGVDMGVIGWSAIHSVLAYNCALRGNNVWTKAQIESNQTWNDDGIRLPGQGNCAFENTLHGFGDAFAVNDGAFSAAVYYYRNLVTMSGDDGFEADYATRNIGFYDNHLTNTATFLSLDPLWGGPLYCFRNISVNTVRGPFKLNNTNSGFLIYSNTLIRTDGTTGWGWVQFNNGALRNWAYRNNIFIYRGAHNLLAIESGANDPVDFTHNAWYPDRSIWWTNSGGSFTGLAAARAGLPATRPVAGSSARRHENDVVSAENPFTVDIALGADHLTEIATTLTPILATGAAARNAGIAIPGITDGYNGAKPDMGAVIGGRPLPRWGGKQGNGP